MRKRWVILVALIANLFWLAPGIGRLVPSRTTGRDLAYQAIGPPNRENAFCPRTGDSCFSDIFLPAGQRTERGWLQVVSHTFWIGSQQAHRLGVLAWTALALSPNRF